MFLRKKYIIIFAHIILWAILGFIFIAHVPLTIGLNFPKEYWIKQSVMFSLLIGLYYLNGGVLVPRLLYRQKPVKFILLHLAIIALLCSGGFIYDGWAHIQEGIVRSINEKFVGKLQITLTGIKLDTTLLLTSCLLVGLSTSISITRLWQKDLLRSQQLVQKQLDSELSFLKAQIHPHFFFNTLNNIYALTFIDVESSRASLHKLSRMMRYLLYETQNDRTSLQREVDFVKDYIQLMQLRVNGHTTVQFEEPRAISEKVIAPMILLPFVENAFKHGVHAVKESRISVKVRQEGDLLTLEVENTLFARRGQSIDDGGIGLSNTKRRLDLIYAEHYQLHCGPEQDKYCVRLELEL
ncbi:MAG: histidine kinase [Chitinophagaceae bacterium]|nr:histidine kinase [Chitinophagaceae bacterium]